MTIGFGVAEKKKQKCNKTSIIMRDSDYLGKKADILSKQMAAGSNPST